MEKNFWLKRWQKRETGFHQEELNPYLGYFYGEKGPAPEKRGALKVFVPLCGKSLDMFWLAQNGYEVLGNECSEIAVKDFFENHQLDYQIIREKLFTRYISEAGPEGRSRIEILLGDFFDLSPDDLEGITDIYDRASMIALPEDMRRAYADKMFDLQNEGMRTLLITLTYPQDEMQGPPFSVTEEEVADFYGEHFKIDKLLGKNIIDDEPSFQQKGVSSLYESAYKLTRK
ncbi:MAG: thiopurine S-methyltransferase [Gammaproteobacteria bacterium]|nr:thiopurine S-methyltransferase [Gammaproteobacteria bacterium]MCW8922155.1 thiopurine S-methyltransferase [Gammaproteobacteria bacterium]